MTITGLIDPRRVFEKEIGLDSRRGENHHIPNTQSFDMGNVGHLSGKILEEFAKQTAAIPRTQTSSLIFNCHGLTFASRRTSIHEEDVVRRLLANEDDYTEMHIRDVLPGDIVVYYGPRNTIPHTGVVISMPQERDFGMPWIVSKWGHFREYMHRANQVPPQWSYETLKFYRVTK